MMATIDHKTIDVSAYKTSDTDTGSASYQVASLTKKIAELTEHCKVHKKDKSAVRGMITMVNQRKKLLTYLRRTSLTTFNKIVKELNLRYRTSQ